MEPMAIERLVAARLELEGYTTLLRVPYKRGHGHGDIDVLAFRPRPLEPPQVVVAECKAWGRPEDYPTYKRNHIQAQKFRKDLDHVREAYRRFLNGPTNVWKFDNDDSVEFWLVVPGAVHASLAKEVADHWRPNYKLVAIHDLLGQLFPLVQKDSKRRRTRYADTAQEMIRWLLRAHYHGHFDLTQFGVAGPGAKSAKRKRKEVEPERSAAATV